MWDSAFQGCSRLSFEMQGEATVPSNLGDEFDTNPFLRPSDPNIRKSLGEHGNKALYYTLLAEALALTHRSSETILKLQYWILQVA